MRPEKTINYALRPVSQKFPRRRSPLKRFQCLSDWRWPSLVLSSQSRPFREDRLALPLKTTCRTKSQPVSYVDLCFERLQRLMWSVRPLVFSSQLTLTTQQALNALAHLVQIRIKLKKIKLVSSETVVTVRSRRRGNMHEISFVTWTYSTSQGQMGQVSGLCYLKLIEAVRPTAYRYHRASHCLYTSLPVWECACILHRSRSSVWTVVVMCTVHYNVCGCFLNSG